MWYNYVFIHIHKHVYNSILRYVCTSIFKYLFIYIYIYICISYVWIRSLILQFCHSDYFLYLILFIFCISYSPQPKVQSRWAPSGVRIRSRLLLQASLPCPLSPPVALEGSVGFLALSIQRTLDVIYINVQIKTNWVIDWLINWH